MPITGLGKREDVQFVLPFALCCIQHQQRTDHLSKVFWWLSPFLVINNWLMIVV